LPGFTPHICLSINQRFCEPIYAGQFLNKAIAPTTSSWCAKL